MNCHCKTNLNDLYEFCTTAWSPSDGHTHRGFELVEFRDAYGQDCSLQESSSVDPHVWLGVGGCRMHLNPAQARGIAERLLDFADANADWTADE